MKHFFGICCFMLLSFTVFSQTKQDKRFQRIEAAKIGYITEQLKLSPEEAAKFFPIYNQYRAEIRSLYRARKGGRNNHLQRNNLNEIEFDSKVVACKKKYREAFKKVISPAKASQFFVVEREFREKLFKELQQRRDRERP